MTVRRWCVALVAATLVAWPAAMPSAYAADNGSRPHTARETGLPAPFRRAELARRRPRAPGRRARREQLLRLGHQLRLGSGRRRRPHRHPQLVGMVPGTELRPAISPLCTRRAVKTPRTPGRWPTRWPQTRSSCSSPASQFVAGRRAERRRSGRQPVDRGQCEVCLQRVAALLRQPTGQVVPSW